MSHRSKILNTIKEKKGEKISESNEIPQESSLIDLDMIRSLSEASTVILDSSDTEPASMLEEQPPEKKMKVESASFHELPQSSSFHLSIMNDPPNESVDSGKSIFPSNKVRFYYNLCHFGFWIIFLLNGFYSVDTILIL